MGALRGYWGIVGLVLSIACWAGLIAGTVTATLLVLVTLVLSVAAGGYFLIQVPLWCRAETSAGQPRRNKLPRPAARLLPARAQVTAPEARLLAEEVAVVTFAVRLTPSCRCWRLPGQSR